MNVWMKILTKESRSTPYPRLQNTKPKHKKNIKAKKHSSIESNMQIWHKKHRQGNLDIS